LARSRNGIRAIRPCRRGTVGDPMQREIKQAAVTPVASWLGGQIPTVGPARA